MGFFRIWRRHPGFVTFNLSTSQNWFSQIFLDSLGRPNHSAKFWTSYIPKIPRKCTVLRLQPFENSILGFRKVEILNFKTSVRAIHGRRADTSDHQDIEWRGTHKYSASKCFAKENSSHAKKETDWLGWFYWFEYHILGMLDIWGALQKKGCYSTFQPLKRASRAENLGNMPDHFLHLTNI